jgi:hypothetical protein
MIIYETKKPNTRHPRTFSRQFGYFKDTNPKKNGITNHFVDQMISMPLEPIHLSRKANKSSGKSEVPKHFH